MVVAASLTLHALLALGLFRYAVSPAAVLGASATALLLGGVGAV